MNNEKMLIKVEEKNIFKRLLNFIKGIFSKKQINNIPDYVPQEKDNSFSSKMEAERKMYRMQNDYEGGRIKESEMTEEEKNNLLNLYNEQIRNLKMDIEKHNKILQEYKEKILIAKSKLS